MDERTVELTIISAQDLKKVSTFGHEVCYAVAYVYSGAKKSTKVDRDGGVNPTWNAKVDLTCDNKLLSRAGSYIIVEIYTYGTFSNKLVGTSKISLLDVGKQALGESRRAAYEVRRPSGKVKGVLNVSVKLGETKTVTLPSEQTAAAAYSSGETRRKPQKENGTPLGYPQTYPPTSWGTEATAAYPPPKASGYGSSGAAYDNGISAYPPQKPSSESFAAGSVYPPPKPSDGDSKKKQEEPVTAYPATGIPFAYPPQQFGHGQQYGGPQHYSSQYAAGPQQYYSSGQPSYGYQQQGQYSQPPRYSKPHKPYGRSSGGGAGMGLLGGVLGGLLLGDVIGDIF